jgi:hypothetical protein
VIYDPDHDLYAVLGVPAGAVRDEIRAAISRKHATIAVQDLALASRLLLTTGRRLQYDLQRAATRLQAFADRLYQTVTHTLMTGLHTRRRRRATGWWRRGGWRRAR